MNEEKISGAKLLVAVVVLGSVCGLVEVIGGGLIRQAGIPFRAGLLTGIGFTVIGFGMAIFKRPLIALGIGMVAILCKQLVVPILHISVVCKLNSCLAVMLEYGALSAIAAITIGRMKEQTESRIFTGGAAAFAGSIAFYIIGMRVAPCMYLLSFNNIAGFGSYLVKESLSWTVFSALLFPLGWRSGERLTERAFTLARQKPGLFYTGATLATFLCWVICALAIYQDI